MGVIGSHPVLSTRAEASDVITGNFLDETPGETSDITIGGLRRSNLNYDTESVNNAVRLLTNGMVRVQINNNGNVGIGLTPTANMAGLSIEAGLLTLKETTTPNADTNYGKIYTKTDNFLYFQDGAGTESELAKITKGSWSPVNGDFGTWTAPTFTTTFTKQGSLILCTLIQTGGTIDPTAAGKYFTGLPFTPSQAVIGSVSDGGFSDKGLVHITTTGRLYFTSNMGSQTSLTLSFTYPTEG